MPLCLLLLWVSWLSFHCKIINQHSPPTSPTHEKEIFVPHHHQHTIITTTTSPPTPLFLILLLFYLWELSLFIDKHYSTYTFSFFLFAWIFVFGISLYRRSVTFLSFAYITTMKIYRGGFLIARLISDVTRYQNLAIMAFDLCYCERMKRCCVTQSGSN